MELTWEAPAQCPSGLWIRRRVGRYLGSTTPDGAPRSVLQVSGSVERVGTNFVARLVLRSGQAARSRELRDRDCVLVADAAAFIMAVAIDPAVRPQDAPLTPQERRGANGAAPQPTSTTPSGTGRGAGPAAQSASGKGQASGAAPGPARAESVEERQEPAAPAQPEPEPEPEPEPPGAPLEVGWAFGARVGLALQPLPDLSPGAALHAALRLGSALRVELSIGYHLPQELPLASDTSVAVHFALLEAELAVCAVGGSHGSHLGLCLSALAGAMRADGAQELSAGNQADGGHLALALGPLLLQRLADGLALRFELAPTVALVRPRFRLTPGTVVYQPEIVGFRALLGAELQLD